MVACIFELIDFESPELKVPDNVTLDIYCFDCAESKVDDNYNYQNLVTAKFVPITTRDITISKIDVLGTNLAV